jgi:hypothetical protein
VWRGRLAGWIKARVLRKMQVDDSATGSESWEVRVRRSWKGGEFGWGEGGIRYETAEGGVRKRRQLVDGERKRRSSGSSWGSSGG